MNKQNERKRIKIEYGLSNFEEVDIKAMQGLKNTQYFYEQLKEALAYLKIILASADFKTKSGSFKVMREKDWEKISHSLKNFFRGNTHVTGVRIMPPGSRDRHNVQVYFPCISLHIHKPTSIKNIYGEDTWFNIWETYVLGGILSQQEGRLNPDFKKEIDAHIDFVNSELTKIREAFKHHNRAAEKAKALIAKVLGDIYELEEVIDNEVYPSIRLHYNRPYLRTSSTLFTK